MVIPKYQGPKVVLGSEKCAIFTTDGDYVRVKESGTTEARIYAKEGYH